MFALTDKLVLLICCFTFYMVTPTEAIGVFYLLGAITLSCLISYFDSKKISFIFVLVFILISLFFPSFCFYIPLIAYDLYSFRHLGLSIAALLIFISFGALNTPMTVVIIMLLCIISLLLQYKSERLLQLDTNFKKLRDTSTEYNLLLRSKNKDLMEKQDYEIHLATLKERNRIAREIHDNVGHVLSRSLLQLGAIMAINIEQNTIEPLTALKDTLSKAMTCIRESVHDLHDDSIDLYSTIQGLLKDFETYEIDFDFDMAEDVPKNIKYCLISITKEALSNISKHSNATCFRLVLREHPGLYQLFMEDNGTNIRITSTGIGLENMNDRVTSLGGTFHTNIENGFKIFVSIPRTLSQI